MTAAVAAVNLVLGVAYCGYGVMTSIEMKRDWKSFGFSHFGAAWICMAFTCGPHHLVHGIHTALAGHNHSIALGGLVAFICRRPVHLTLPGRIGGPLDLFAVVVGLPAGVIWLALRVEAFAGGRGDRYIKGTPLWLAALPFVGVAYVVVLVATAVPVLMHPVHVTSLVIVNLTLLVIYMAIGSFLLRTQLRNHPSLAGWSVSGVSLTAVFPTCALMHAVWAVYALSGKYHFDVQGAYIDWLSIPAALYFLWVIRGLYRDSLRDWNSATVDEAAELAPVMTG